MEPKNFEEYYQYYLTLHQKRATKIFHIVGNFVTVFYVIIALYLGYLNYIYLLSLFAAPFVVYPFAWYSHMMIEKNKPAAWSNPVWAKMCDWRMIYDIFTGKIKM